MRFHCLVSALWAIHVVHPVNPVPTSACPAPPVVWSLLGAAENSQPCHFTQGFYVTRIRVRLDILFQHPGGEPVDPLLKGEEGMLAKCLKKPGGISGSMTNIP